MRMFSYSSFLVYLFLTGCASHPGTTTGTTTPQSGKYSEDLTPLRPKIEPTTNNTEVVVHQPNPAEERQQMAYVEPRHAVNKQLDNVLDSINNYNRAQRNLDGFTIQIYSGARREEALNAKKQLVSVLPDIPSEVQYVQPNFRVKAGKYFQRIDAQKDYMVVKRYFPNAIVIPDRIAIN